VHRTTLTAWEYAINHPRVWHSADIVDGATSDLFVTAGMGTEHRSREVQGPTHHMVNLRFLAA
jgi:hypothetical protein